MSPTLVDVVEKTRQEDFAIIESVQRGLKSQGFGQGVLLIDDTLSEKMSILFTIFSNIFGRRLPEKAIV